MPARDDIRMSRHPTAPPPAEITFEQVAAAAENFEGRGAEPTLQRVCAHLGGGSPHRIQRHPSAWRAGREPAPLPAPRLPEALIEALERELAQQASAALARGEQLAEEARADAASLAELGEALEQRLAEQESRLDVARSEEHTSELQSRPHLVCRLLLEKKKMTQYC